MTGTNGDKPDLSQVQELLIELGYNLTRHGAAYALLSLGSNFSVAETASDIATVTLARDAREAGSDAMTLVGMASHAAAMLKALRSFVDAGLMREDLFKNDGMAMMMVTRPDRNQAAWIDQVLADPTAGSQRLATSRIPYKSE